MKGMGKLHPTAEITRKIYIDKFKKGEILKKYY